MGAAIWAQSVSDHAPAAAPAAAEEEDGGADEVGAADEDVAPPLLLPQAANRADRVTMGTISFRRIVQA